MSGKKHRLQLAIADDCHRPAADAVLSFPSTIAIVLGAPPTHRLSHPSDAVPDADTSHLSDDDLMRRFQAGDEPSFLELYKRRHAAIFTFCLRMCGGDRELGKDVFQETFIRIHGR